MENNVRIYDAKKKIVENVPRIEKSDADWRKLLTNKEYEITTKHGTEAPGSRTFNDVHGPGIFKCIRCDTDLFSSSTKFESGTGWPSFYEPVSPLNVVLQPDHGFGVARIEVLCARCGSHLWPCLRRRPPTDRQALLHERLRS
jgi:peptide-methionine (R)-S-oxide reductase